MPPIDQPHRLCAERPFRDTIRASPSVSTCIAFDSGSYIHHLSSVLLDDRGSPTFADTDKVVSRPAFEHSTCHERKLIAPPRRLSVVSRSA
jgi:hypothetical protein